MELIDGTNHVISHTHLRTREFCWQPFQCLHALADSSESDWGQKARILLNGVPYTISITYATYCRKSQLP